MDSAPGGTGHIGSTAGLEPSGLKRIFRALRHRNYKLYFGGQFVSLMGTFLTMSATAWLVLRLTGSAKWLGVIGFTSQIPTFALGPFAGVWVDRVDRRRLIVITQVLAMLQSFALAVLALSGIINITELLILSLVQGLINAFDIPARQAFLVEMITDRQDLPNAIALNSTMVHGARVFGPAVAGVLIGFFGEGLCFTIDGISYIGVILALLAMTVAAQPAREKRSVGADLKEGLAYIWGHVPIRVLLIVMSLISLTGMPAMAVLLPVFGKNFGGAGKLGPLAYGILGASSGVGAFCAAIYLASRRTVVGLGRVMTIAMFVLSGGIVAFAWSRYFALSVLIAPVIGWGMITVFASANTLLQTMTDDDKRGRVMSFFAMAFIGMTPWGSLLAGYMADKLTPAHVDRGAVIGAARTLGIEGGLCALAAFSFAWMLPRLRKLIRPIYVKKGILPAVADGLQAAATIAEVVED